jgi:photosystem II stability/assembly factor-like uncharacterized protein
MYARTDVGGADRWDAGTERWVPITDWMGQDDWHDYAEHAPGWIVRVGTRGGDRARERDIGAYSSDGGRTWRAFGSYPAGAQAGGIAVSADAGSWVWAPWGAAPHATSDRAATRRPCRGLPVGSLQILADRATPDLFYAVARAGGSVHVSRDGGATFAPTAATLPPLEGGRACAVFNHPGHLWLPAGGRLWRSIDGGATLTALEGLTAVTHISVGLAQPAPAAPSYPTLFAVGKLHAEQGFYRSTDAGRSWKRINDDANQFGQIRVIAGDPKRFGRLYIGTGGRGVVDGDVAPESGR